MLIMVVVPVRVATEVLVSILFQVATHWKSFMSNPSICLADDLEADYGHYLYNTFHHCLCRRNPLPPPPHHHRSCRLKERKANEYLFKLTIEEGMLNLKLHCKRRYGHAQASKVCSCSSFEGAKEEE
ncbi:hypothetical protein LINPERHAP2_LOCUS38266 [Linum perenne]